MSFWNNNDGGDEWDGRSWQGWKAHGGEYRSRGQERNDDWDWCEPPDATERRVAANGVPYTFADFQQFYGSAKANDIWYEAPTAPPEPWPPQKRTQNNQAAVTDTLADPTRQQVRTQNDQAAVADTPPAASPEPTAEQVRTPSHQAAVADTSAVPAPEQVWTQHDEAAVFEQQHFRRLKLTCHWTDHNIALKWFRDSSERVGLSVVIFSNTQAQQVPQIDHPKGMFYQFIPDGNSKPWFWQEMVAQMDDESMRKVVQGLDNRSRGLTSCRLQETDKYDHVRHHGL